MYIVRQIQWCGQNYLNHPWCQEDPPGSRKHADRGCHPGAVSERLGPWGQFFPKYRVFMLSYYNMQQSIKLKQKYNEIFYAFLDKVIYKL